MEEEEESELSGFIAAQQKKPAWLTVRPIGRLTDQPGSRPTAGEGNPPFSIFVCGGDPREREKKGLGLPPYLNLDRQMSKLPHSVARSAQVQPIEPPSLFLSPLKEKKRPEPDLYGAGKEKRSPLAGDHIYSRQPKVYVERDKTRFLCLFRIRAIFLSRCRCEEEDILHLSPNDGTETQERVR